MLHRNLSGDWTNRILLIETSLVVTYAPEVERWHGLFFQIPQDYHTAIFQDPSWSCARISQILELSEGKLSLLHWHTHRLRRRWYGLLVQDTLSMPDERQLTKGIGSTDVPALLRSMVDSLVWESTRIEEGYVMRFYFGRKVVLNPHLVIEALGHV